jgi:hypothetical protein
MMSDPTDPDGTDGSSSNSDDFNLDWDALSFSTAPRTHSDWLLADEWEDRFTQDTTGYVADSLTTSFTDLDLGSAQVDLRNTSEWADLDSWSDA